MKKYKIGNKFIVADSAIRAVKIAKIFDSIKDEYFSYKGASIYKHPTKDLYMIEGFGESYSSLQEAKKAIDDDIKNGIRFDSIKDNEEIDYLTKEEEQAVEDYRKAIAGTTNPKLLELYKHILDEELEHIKELEQANNNVEDSVKDVDIISGVKFHNTSGPVKFIEAYKGHAISYNSNYNEVLRQQGYYQIHKRNGFFYESAPTIEAARKQIDLMKDSISDMPMKFRSNISLEAFKSNVDSLKQKYEQCETKADVKRMLEEETSLLKSLKSNFDGALADIEEFKKYEKNGTFDKEPNILTQAKKLTSAYQKLLLDPIYMNLKSYSKFGDAFYKMEESRLNAKNEVLNNSKSYMTKNETSKTKEESNSKSGSSERLAPSTIAALKKRGVDPKKFTSQQQASAYIAKHPN